jgi:ferric-dicitrate binding protein FerR (iron transport regulator)
MKKWIEMIGSITCLLIVFSIAEARSPLTVKITQGEAKITTLRGTAQAVCPAQKETQVLKTHDMIQAGCIVTTGADSRLELALPDRSVVRFAEKTKFKLISADVTDEGKRSVGISVGVGKVWMNVRKSLQGGDDKFEVSCQNAVAGVRGTVYRMDVENDQSAQVKVYEGEVNVAAASGALQAPVMAVGPPRPVAGPTSVAGPKPVSIAEWGYIVKSMQKIQISADGRAEEPKAFTESEDMDDWVKWNKKRDRRNR